MACVVVSSLRRGGGLSTNVALGTLHGVMVNELSQQFIVSEFDSHWMLYGFVLN